MIFTNRLKKIFPNKKIPIIKAITDSGKKILELDSKIKSKKQLSDDLSKKIMTEKEKSNPNLTILVAVEKDFEQIKSEINDLSTQRAKELSIKEWKVNNSLNWKSRIKV